MTLYKANAENKVTNTTSFIDSGITKPNSYLELNRIESKTSKNGNNFLAFYWKDPSGAEVSKTEWEPKDNDPEVLQQKADRLMARINHMLVDSGILQEQEMNFEIGSFKELGDKLIALAITSGRNKGKQVRAKVVYDNSGFTTLPNYTTYPWIEPATILPEESKMRILGIDQMERVKPDEEKAKPENPFIETPNTGATIDENDPFAQAA
jgi:hypothetical protein